MTDRESFLAHLAARPSDRVAQLAFADFLEEHGEPALAARVREFDGVPCLTCRAIGAADCLECCGAHWLRRCGHEGCGNQAEPCYVLGTFPAADGLVPYAEDAAEWYCLDHAADHGFCPRCLFLTSDPGPYCEDCAREIAREDAAGEDFFDWGEFYDWEDGEDEDDYP